MWAPEILLVNPSEKLKPLGEDWNSIRYYSNGKADWFPGDLIKATCSINVYYFPFDVQECSVFMQVWAYGANEVKLNASRNYVDISQMPSHGSWTVIETKAQVTEFSGASRAEFTFRLQRKPQYVIMNVILPIMFLCALNVIAFLLPVDSGERISYAITVLLAFAVYMTIVSDTLPKSSEPLPLIAYLLIICLIVSVLVTVVIVFNLRLFYKRSDEPVPKWLLRINHALRCTSCRRDTDNGDKANDDIHISSSTTDNGRLASNKVAPLPTDTSDKTHTRRVSVTWQD